MKYRFIFLILILIISNSELFSESKNPSKTQSTLFANLIQSDTAHLNSTQLDNLLTLATGQVWNVFDLLNELTLDLQNRKIRVEIDGDLLRRASEKYRLGDHRVFAIFPLEKVIRITLGYTANTAKTPALEVFLEEPHTQFLELGDFSLQTYYGFRSNRYKVLDQAFGVQVKNGIFNFDLEKIERVPDPTGGVNQNFIAIHVKMFFRPKRWQIDPIRLWIPGEDREASKKS